MNDKPAMPEGTELCLKMTKRYDGSVKYLDLTTTDDEAHITGRFFTDSELAERDDAVAREAWEAGADSAGDYERGLGNRTFKDWRAKRSEGK